MRIHTDTLTESDLQEAADFARVNFDRYVTVNSRSHAHGFDITLQGESRRHQNGGSGMAATWDQWGCFFGYLFSKDENMVAGTVKRPVYADRNDFNYKTGYRFDGDWPEDAHGDHTFRFQGVPYQQSCTKCSAETRWK
jgi:hypothetical protein